MRRLLRIAGLCLAFIVLGATPAAAHGPCPHCIEPATAHGHSKLRVDYPTFRAVWNPPRRVLTKGPKPDCYGCNLGLWRFRVPGSPSVVVYDGPRKPGLV